MCMCGVCTCVITCDCANCGRTAYSDLWDSQHWPSSLTQVFRTLSSGNQDNGSLAPTFLSVKCEGHSAVSGDKRSLTVQVGCPCKILCSPGLVRTCLEAAIWISATLREGQSARPGLGSDVTQMRAGSLHVSQQMKAGSPQMRAGSLQVSPQIEAGSLQMRAGSLQVSPQMKAGSLQMRAGSLQVSPQMKAGSPLPQAEEPSVLCYGMEVQVSTAQVIVEMLVSVEGGTGGGTGGEETDGGTGKGTGGETGGGGTGGETGGEHTSPSAVDPQEGLVLHWTKLDFSLGRQDATGKCCGLELLSRSHIADSTHYIVLPTTLEFCLHQHLAASSLDM